MNQGMNNTRVYLERQMYSLRTFGMSVKGLDNLSGQLTLLCFLAGGGAAFLSYWFRSDNYYIVLYGTTGILAGKFTMLVDYGEMSMRDRYQGPRTIAGGKRDNAAGAGRPDIYS